MLYSTPKRLGVEISRIGLGGHEFLPDGRSRGFNEDYAKATTPGVIFPGFGGDKRKSVLREAYASGINLFDVTIDSEKEALARNMVEMPPLRGSLIQTRPEGMCWQNNPADPHNQQLADYQALKAEVKRILKLTGWSRIGFLNFGFMGSALKVNPGYLEALSKNIASLKEEGLIQFATGDTFSGEEVYLRMLDTGAFDAIFLTISFANDGGLRRILPEAESRGIAVFAREVYAKGELWKWGEEAGISDRNLLARTAMKWLLALPQVSSVIVGAGTPEEVREAVGAMENPDVTAEEAKAYCLVSETRGYKEYLEGRRKEFWGEGKE
jgi:aryl-alcohol dehydrogenase-like predicted oxidoreductase